MTTIAPLIQAAIRHPLRHRRHSRHQRSGHSVSVLADLHSSRRGNQHPIRLPARAQCRPQRTRRHLAAHRLHLHPRPPHQGASRRHDHCLRLLHPVSGQLHPAPRTARRRALPRPRGLAHLSICRCWPATSSSPSSPCPWCWSRFSFRSPAEFPAPQNRSLDLSRSGSTFPSPASSPMSCCAWRKDRVPMSSQPSHSRILASDIQNARRRHPPTAAMGRLDGGRRPARRHPARSLSRRIYAAPAPAPTPAGSRSSWP